MKSTMDVTYRPLTKEERECLEGGEYEEALRDGRMAVSSHTVTAAARLVPGLEEAEEEEGEACEACLLVLDGERLIYLDYSTGHPSERLKINQLPHSGEIIGFEMSGRPLDASLVAVYEVPDWSRLPEETTFQEGTLDAMVNTLGLQPLQIPLEGPVAVSISTLPQILHPRVRPYRRGLLAYRLIGLFILAIGVVPISVTLSQALALRDTPFIEWTSVIFCLPFLLAPIFGIPFIMKAARTYMAFLRLASATLHEAMPDQVPVIFRYSLLISGSSFRKNYEVVLPADYARAHRVPKRFEVLPPVGPVKKTLSKIDWSRTGKSESYTQDVVTETAAVYCGASGMVVIETSQGSFIRQLEMQAC